MISFDDLKYKERDELEDVISSYHAAHKFDIEKYRDDRARFHYKERYDVRRNVIDWDYSFSVVNICKYINKREYMAWRLRGIAWETRLASQTIPNRTFSSYVPG